MGVLDQPLVPAYLIRRSIAGGKDDRLRCCRRGFFEQLRVLVTTRAWRARHPLCSTSSPRFLKDLFGISFRSLAFSLGINTFFNKPRWAARIFSFRPPMGRTRPRR